MNNKNMKNQDREIKNPYNENNILITKPFIESIFEKYKVKIVVKNLTLYQRAMCHKSYTTKEFYTPDLLKKFKLEKSDKSFPELQRHSYERLEFLGDSVIKTIIAGYLFKRYPNEDEGFMTNLKIKLENKKNFAFLSKLLGFDKYLLLSSSIETAISRNANSLLEDIFEGFVGAMYLENNFDLCNVFIINLFETEIDFSGLLFTNDNYKSLLLQYYHKNHWNTPRYKLQSIEGPSNKRKFIVGVFDNNNKIIAHGKGFTKQSAEQNASKFALIYYKQLQIT